MTIHVIQFCWADACHSIYRTQEPQNWMLRLYQHQRAVLHGLNAIENIRDNRSYNEALVQLGEQVNFIWQDYYQSVIAQTRSRPNDSEEKTRWDGEDNQRLSCSSFSWIY